VRGRRTQVRDGCDDDHPGVLHAVNIEEVERAVVRARAGPVDSRMRARASDAAPHVTSHDRRKPMRQAIAILLLACAARGLESQEAGGAGGRADTTNPAAVAPSPGGMEAGAGAAAGPEHEAAMAEWERVRGHWALVQSLPEDQKPQHLEMHRAMLDTLMTRLEAHSAEAREMEGRGPTVGERMERADREPVSGERPEEQSAEAAAEAAPRGKADERIDEARVEDEERRAAHEAMTSSIEEVLAHWQVVRGIQDPGQLEEHLAMHMDLLAGLHEGMSEGHGGHGAHPASGQADHEAEHGAAAGHGAEHGDEGGRAAPRPGDRPAGY
jgi:hypothetical protein